MAADLGVAFLAGLVSCASACVLPLLPAMVAYLGRLGSPASSRLAVLGHAGLFVAGFGTAFTALGAGAAVLGGSLVLYRSALVSVSGALLIALGVMLLAGLPLASREWRFHVAHRLPRTPLASYLVGVTFAVGWTPCVGPILAAILVLAADTATAWRGAELLAAYSAGLGLPFLAVAAFFAPVSALLRRLRGAHTALNIAAATVLVTMGALTLTDRLTVVNGLVPELGLSAPPARLSAALPSPASAGRAMPAVTVVDVDDHRLALRTLRGRPVVVTFWATWCVPCRQELPMFAAAARAHAAEGLAIVPIDFQESSGAVRGFWAELGLSLTAYLDPDGAAARAFGVGLRETGLPVTVLADRGGVIRSVIPGQADPQLFASRLARVLPP